VIVALKSLHNLVSRWCSTIEGLVRRWFIGKVSSSCQIFCPLKIQPFWKVFCFQTIRGLFTCEVLFLLLLIFILKTQLSLHIVVLKTCNSPWKQLLTLHFETWALAISFWWVLQIQNCIICGWEGQKVRLWKMNNLKNLNIFILNGGC